MSSLIFTVDIILHGSLCKKLHAWKEKKVKKYKNKSVVKPVPGVITMGNIELVLTLLYISSNKLDGNISANRLSTLLLEKQETGTDAANKTICKSNMKIHIHDCKLKFNIVVDP